jgi:hypothetical protein
MNRAMILYSLAKFYNLATDMEVKAASYNRQTQEEIIDVISEIQYIVDTYILTLEQEYDTCLDNQLLTKS